MSGERIWSYLEPEQIEVSNARYYGDGRIAILLIFNSTRNMDFSPAIETTDGRFRQVLSARRFTSKCATPLLKTCRGSHKLTAWLTPLFTSGCTTISRTKSHRTFHFRCASAPVPPA